MSAIVGPAHIWDPASAAIKFLVDYRYEASLHKSNDAKTFFHLRLEPDPVIARRSRMARCGRLPALVFGHVLVAAIVQTAIAGSDTDVLTVSVTVQSGCSLNGGTLDFGVYVSGQATDLDGTGAIGFTNCNGTLVVELDGGGSGSVTERQLQAGDDRLSYQLFRSPSRSAPWGSGLEAREVTLLATQSGEIQVYGRIPGGQSTPDGAYTDLVNVTLTF